MKIKDTNFFLYPGRFGLGLNLHAEEMSGVRTMNTRFGSTFLFRMVTLVDID